MATLVNGFRGQSPNTLFCDCGDTLHGTYPALATQGEAMIPILNSLVIDVMTAHWEFAYGPRKFQHLASQLNYPVLAINAYDKNTKKRIFKPYTVTEVSGISIGLIGIASNIVDKTMPPSFSEGIYFTLGRDELPEIVNNLRNREKVELVVLISHLGFPQDMKLLAEVHGIDICLSSHTHNRFYKPISQGKTLIIQSGSLGSFLGCLDLELGDGKIKNYHHQLIEVTADIKPDPETADLVKEVLSPFQASLAETVGETATGLYRGLVLESTMDNFILQALLESTGAQLAFSNGWRYGAPIRPGKVTLNDLYNMVPMNPPVSTVELTGGEIQSMLEENLEHTFSADPYQQTGGYVKRCLGLTCYFKIENPPGHRIQKLFIGKEEVQPEQYYSCAFITSQGVPQKYGRNRQNHAEKIIDTLRVYLNKHNPMHADIKNTFIAI
ncbi:MAG: bifunctional metallophosphatase/5'-nucleotidase [Firmicutes bacterium]|nr:bifunctional metallophosphatase/5'-nucleotidase [Bacillota bacterium]